MFMVYGENSTGKRRRIFLETGSNGLPSCCSPSASMTASASTAGELLLGLLAALAACAAPDPLRLLLLAEDELIPELA